ncbi:MAG: transposase [Myxococcales bacterium]|nr:transposase [Myxococcales bacterium]
METADRPTAARARQCSTDSPSQARQAARGFRRDQFCGPGASRNSHRSEAAKRPQRPSSFRNPCGSTPAHAQWKARETGAFLVERIGWMQGDGYKAYETIAKDRPILLVGCWMHCRRYFHKAFEAGDPRAAVALDRRAIRMTEDGDL